MVEIWDPTDGPPLAKQFTFDSVYDQKSATESIYNDICYPLIEVNIHLSKPFIILLK